MLTPPKPRHHSVQLGDADQLAELMELGSLECIHHDVRELALGGHER
jgi:hypothetical protein